MKQIFNTHLLKIQKFKTKNADRNFRRRKTRLETKHTERDRETLDLVCSSTVK
uniref:Uncharacterized protein n=1 Tax=Rhizophora mucronata TaxID=61149 RepID=A0A2P2M2V5_RHIMU